jgi:hypothetical protein
MTTSDQFLATRNLRPMRDIPNRDGFEIIATRRDGREVEATAYNIRGVFGLAIADPTTIYGDLIGWRPVP